MNVAVNGEKLREARLAKVVDRQELAERSGVSRSAIARIELGQSNARLSTIKKLVSVLGIDPSTLIEREVVTRPGRG